MALREWKIVYFQKGTAPSDDGATFGCSVEGIAGSEASAAEWGIRPMGQVFSGGYEDVLRELGVLAGEGFRPDAAVMFFAKAPGMEAFLRQVCRLLPGIPWGGGGAAKSPTAGSGELLPAAKDVAMLLIRDGRYDFKNVWSNVHDDTGRKVSFRAGGPRTILSVRENSADRPAQDWYSSSRQALGYPVKSFENLALSANEGWNLHSSPEGEFALHTGADLPLNGELSVRCVDGKRATDRITEFCALESALVFGCAGLHSLLQRPVSTGRDTLAGFLHGEVLTAGGSPRFANLMMSGLVAEKINER